MRISVGFYGKSFLFWLSVIFLGFGLFKVAKNVNLTTAEQDSTAIFETSTILRQTIIFNDRGEATIDGLKINKAVFPARDVNHVRIKILDGNPRSFSQSVVRVILPKPLIDDANARGLIIHSYANNVEVTKPATNTIIFSATDIAPNAVYTITFDTPKNYFNLPFGARLAGTLANLPFSLWFGTAIALPLIAGLFFAIQLIKRLRIIMHAQTAPIFNKLPSDIPPAVIGALYHGRITTREIAATFLDLAVHKHLTIYAKERGDFTFAVSTLSPTRAFEKVLLSKLFYEHQQFSRRRDVLYRVGHRIFSQKIARVYWEIYRQLEAAGYFLEPPGKAIGKWRALGTLLFFLSALGFFIGVIFFPEPKFPILLWLGVMVVAILIINLAYTTISFSPKGLNAIRAWAGFKKYLSMQTAATYEEASDGRLARWLPYAIVFGVERQWLKRFTKHPFSPPNWFDSEEKTFGIERFSELILPVTGFVSRLLAESRDPSI